MQLQQQRQYNVKYYIHQLYQQHHYHRYQNLHQLYQNIHAKVSFSCTNLQACKSSCCRCLQNILRENILKMCKKLCCNIFLMSDLYILLKNCVRNLIFQKFNLVLFAKLSRIYMCQCCGLLYVFIHSSHSERSSNFHTFQN